jgi:hypothetical protein
MALWQTLFFIVKESNIKFEKEEEILLWGETQINSESLLKISKVLHHEKSWTDEIIQYGKSEETCLQISYNGNILSEIYCRIDVRNINLEILNEIVNFMVINNAKIFKGNVFYKASVENLISIIRQSNASKFCDNPIKFLHELKD